MKAAGFDVKVTIVNDTTAARKRLGMPGKQDPYHVFLIDKSGRETVFASYPKA